MRHDAGTNRYPSASRLGSFDDNEDIEFPVQKLDTVGLGSSLNQYQQWLRMPVQWLYYNWERSALTANSTSIVSINTGSIVSNSQDLSQGLSQNFSTQGSGAASLHCSTPDLSKAAFVAANATVIGQVAIAPGASIWYGAVVRGDVEQIEIGQCTNIQDGAVLHGDPGKPTILKDYVTVGHRAVVHSAEIGEGSLVGIGAIVLDGVKVGSGCIVGAGSVVTKDVPARSLVVGIPAKVLRPISDEEAAELIEHAHKYEKLALVHAGKGTDPGFH